MSCRGRATEPLMQPSCAQQTSEPDSHQAMLQTGEPTIKSLAQFLIFNHGLFGYQGSAYITEYLRLAAVNVQQRIIKTRPTFID